MLIYIEYLSRRPHVSVEQFHAVLRSMQDRWEETYGEDELLLSVGRTWRIGPEPEYLAVWGHAEGLGQLGEWEKVFASGQAEAIAAPIAATCRIDAAGCYDALLKPVPGGPGRYYAEHFAVAGGTSNEDVAEHFARRSENLPLHLLVTRIGHLGPDPGGLAVWGLPDYGALEQLARQEDGPDAPVRRVAASLYANVGEEVQ